MSAEGHFSESSAELSEAVISYLAEQPELQAVLGHPVRIFDDETRRSAFPFVRLERHETTDTSATGCKSFEHRFQFAVFSRHGGLREAKAILGALRASLERFDSHLVLQRIILVIPGYCDVMRTQNQQIFRGLLRVRIHTEEV